MIPDVRWLALGAGLFSLVSAYAGACDCGQAEASLCAAPMLAAKSDTDAIAAPSPSLLADDPRVQALHGYHGIRQFAASGNPQQGDRLTELALGKRPGSVTSQDFDNPVFQSRISGVVKQNGGLASLLDKKAEKKGLAEMVNPAGPGPANEKIPNRATDTPLVKRGQCLAPAGPADWQPTQDGRLKVIAGTYFPEVARILSRRQGKSTMKTCAMVLLSPSWAVTALHCVLDPATRQTWKDLSGNAADAIRFFFAPNGEEPGQRLSDCFDDARIGTGACPLTRLTVTQIIPGHDERIEFVPEGSDLPRRDLALMRIKNGPKLAQYPQLVDSLPAGRTVTMAGFGTTNATQLSSGFELQVGWVNSGLVVSPAWPGTSGLEYAWVPKADGKISSICPGDSGGAVFAGFESGFCQCGDDRKPLQKSRNLLGLVSYAIGSNSSAPKTPEDCASADKAAAIVPASHLAWMCSQGLDIAACK